MPDPDPLAETRATGATQPPPPGAETFAIRAPSGSDAATLSPAAAAPAPLPPGGRMFGRYRLVAELGRGAMGVVWKAHDTRLDRDVALKQIRAGELAEASQVDRFQREARLAARLVHPAIVAVHDVGVEAGAHYFTSDFVPARSLEVVLREPVPLEKVVAWAKEIAEALHYAHQQGVVHRDVKPANILIDDAGRPHLTDFGLAKEVSLESESSLTASGTLLGTPAYMSPEQATGKLQAMGPASDQFSLGVVLYEMICRARPFAADSLRGLLNAIAEVDPARPTAINRRCPADVETVCLKALEKDPRARYASLGDLAADLGRCLAGEPVRARPIAPLARVLRRAAKRPGVLALVFLVVGLAAYAVVSHRAHAREEEETRRQAAASEQAALEKGARVADVLLRWADLRATFAEMEVIHTDVTLREGERREALSKLRGPIDAFARATPADRTSQAAMKALVAWADLLCGQHDAASAGLRDAASLDSDLPYAALVEAMRRAIPYLASQPLPALLIGPEVLDVAAPEAESPERRRLRLEAQSWLAKAGAARVGGKGLAEDFKKAIDAMAGACAGRYAEADRLLGEVLDRARMPAFETELRYARARTRFYLKRPADALADIDAVCAARPRSAEALRFRALIRLGMGVQRTSRGEDPREEFDAATASMDAAVGLLRKARDPATLAVTLGHRASIRIVRAESAPGDLEADLRLCIADLEEARTLAPPDTERAVVRAAAAMKLAERRAIRGEDPRDWHRISIEACDEALKLTPEDLNARQMRGTVRAARGGWIAGRGEDPREDFATALADLEAVLAKAPDAQQALYQRARLRSIQGQRAKAAGVDAAEAFDHGIADLDRAIGLGESGDLLIERATLLAQRGQAEADQGGDPRPWYGRAVADADAAVRRTTSWDGYCRRALSRTVLGQWLWDQGFDPRPDLRAAVADYEEAIQRNPMDRLSWEDAAQARRSLGEFAEEARAIDKALALPGADAEELKRRLAEARKDLVTLDQERLPAWKLRVEMALGAVQRKDYIEARSDLIRARAWMKPADEAQDVNGYGYREILYDLACLTTQASEGKLYTKPVDAPRAAWLREAAFADLLAAIDHGYADADHLRTDPDFAALRSDPRWKDVEKRLGK